MCCLMFCLDVVYNSAFELKMCRHLFQGKIEVKKFQQEQCYAAISVTK